MDLANLYYFLPAPDCQLKSLWRRATELMQSTNTVDNNIFFDFMDYCKTIDLTRALTIHGKEVKYATVPNYDIESLDWYKRCIKGTLTLPPDSDFGKAWIHKFFPFNDSLPHWFWDAADVTHVTSDVSNYESLRTAKDIPRFQHNELLYALRSAPMLSDKWDPCDIYTHLKNGTDSWDRIAMMASKCENTKPGDKCRETWSADDITRESLTNYDRCALPLASLMSGVTSRKSDQHVNNIFNRICTQLRPDSKSHTIVISNDVSGWSPQADRNAWSIHHDYIVRI